MTQKRILLLVEGEKGEPELLSHFYNLYNVSDIQIISYKTNLYAFYNRLKRDYSDSSGNIEYEFIDLPLFLNGYFNLQGSDRLSKNDFQDILLIFDYDPHDPLYTREKLMDLVTNFVDPTDTGKLYINYPMLESYQDITNLDDDSFYNATVELVEIQRVGKGGINPYKRLVASRTCISSVGAIGKEEGNKLIGLHTQKLNKLIAEDTEFHRKYIEMCEIQCDKLDQENKIWVLATALIHFRDEYGEII